MTDVVFEAPTGSHRRFVDMGDGTHAEQGVAHPPFDLLTDGGDGPNRRLRVDVGQTGFFAGREAYSFYRFSINTATEQVIKVVAPINTIVKMFGASLSLASLDIELRSGGTEGGTFATSLPIFRTNEMSSAQAYTPQVTMAVGGTHTGGTLHDVLELVAGVPLNQAINASVTSENPVGFPAGTYYIKLINTNGATATGVFRARWEERP